MLIQELAEVSTAGSVEALRAVTERVMDGCGFERYSLLVISDLPSGGVRNEGVHNAPGAYLNAYDDMLGALTCPVMQHARHSHLPLLWDKNTYSGDARELWDYQSDFGYGSGVVVAAHLPRGQHVCVGFDRAAELPSDGDALTRMLGEFQIFSAHAIEACIGVLGQPREPEVECPLTKRERECLKWTLESKTAWEVGVILSIGERTVAQHLGSAIQKLGTVNKHAAALKALRLGWIA